MTPFAFVNSQFEPDRLLRSVPEYRIRTTVRAPSASDRPSGTEMVWSLTVAATVAPSTVTGWSRIAPSLAAIVLNSMRSMAAPDALTTVAVEST